MVLAASALAAPLVVLDQGGDLHTAILACLVVLAAPGAAVESMVGAARFAHLLKPG